MRKIALITLATAMVLVITGCPPTPAPPLTVQFTDGRPNLEVTASRTIISCQDVAVKSCDGWELIDLTYNPSFNDGAKNGNWCSYSLCDGDANWTLLFAVIPLAAETWNIINNFNIDVDVNTGCSIDPIPVDELVQSATATYSNGDREIELTVKNPCFTGGEGEGEVCRSETKGTISVVFNATEQYVDVDHHYDSCPSYLYVGMDNNQEPERQGVRVCVGEEMCNVETEAYTYGNLRFNLKPQIHGATEANLFLIAFDFDRPNTEEPEGGFYWAYLPSWEIYVNGIIIPTPTDGKINLSLPAPPNFVLTTSVEGQGTATGAGTYNTGTQVTVTATAATGWHFDHWTGDLSGSVNPTSMVMNTNKSVTAVFVQDDQPPVNAAIVEFTSDGTSGTMRINPGSLTLRQITADASAQYLPEGADFPNIKYFGVEIVNLPSPYWYLRELSSGTMTADSWSTIITLDGVGTDSAGLAKPKVPLANWASGKAIPVYTLYSVPGRIFSLNTGVNCGKLNGQIMAVDTTGFIWPYEKG